MARIEQDTLRVATFNTLADSYIGYSDLTHADQRLLAPGMRIEGLVRTSGSLNADVIALQEVEQPLVEAFETTRNWQTLWSPKGCNKPDGCLTLVSPDLEVEVDDFDTLYFSDNSGHVAQIIRIGQLAIANTHLRWAPLDANPHNGVHQIQELLAHITSPSAILMGDCNDRPRGPVRQAFLEAGFDDVVGETPSALIDQAPVSIDMIAVRGLSAQLIPPNINLSTIPDTQCPSDHIPLIATISRAF